MRHVATKVSGVVRNQLRVSSGIFGNASNLELCGLRPNNIGKYQGVSFQHHSCQRMSSGTADPSTVALHKLLMSEVKFGKTAMSVASDEMLSKEDTLHSNLEEQQPADSESIPFHPTEEWQIVPDGSICPPGLQYAMDLETGRTSARFPPKLTTHLNVRKKVQYQA